MKRVGLTPKEYKCFEMMDKVIENFIGIDRIAGNLFIVTDCCNRGVDGKFVDRFRIKNDTFPSITLENSLVRFCECYETEQMEITQNTQEFFKKRFNKRT